jgi:hypothetical protein
MNGDAKSRKRRREVKEEHDTKAESNPGRHEALEALAIRSHVGTRFLTSKLPAAMEQRLRKSGKTFLLGTQSDWQPRLSEYESRRMQTNECVIALQRTPGLQPTARFMDYVETKHPVPVMHEIIRPWPGQNRHQRLIVNARGQILPESDRLPQALLVLRPPPWIHST